MVSAAGAPLTPADLRDDEIVVNQWLADDLQVKPGEFVDLTYFLAESGAQLVERTNRFRVRAVVPLAGIHDDRTLMPEFPGLSKAESTHEWDAGFPLVHKIRDKDEQYWKDHRGNAKGIRDVCSRPGNVDEPLWESHFDSYSTSGSSRQSCSERAGGIHELFAGQVRDHLEATLLQDIEPAWFGLRFDPCAIRRRPQAARRRILAACFSGSVFFLIVAALILMALLFQFGLEQRATETGTLLALGFTPRQVRRLLLREGVLVAFVAGCWACSADRLRASDAPSFDNAVARCGGRKCAAFSCHRFDIVCGPVRELVGVRDDDRPCAATTGKTAGEGTAQ